MWDSVGRSNRRLLRIRNDPGWQLIGCVSFTPPRKPVPACTPHAHMHPPGRRSSHHRQPSPGQGWIPKYMPGLGVIINAFVRPGGGSGFSITSCHTTWDIRCCTPWPAACPWAMRHSSTSSCVMCVMCVMTGAWGCGRSEPDGDRECSVVPQHSLQRDILFLPMPSSCRVSLPGVDACGGRHNAKAECCRP